MIKFFLPPAFLTVFLITPSIAEDVPRATLDKFFGRYCNDCHADGADEGGFDLESLGNDLADPASFKQWERIFDRVRLREMPPKDSDSVPDKNRATFGQLLGKSLTAAHAAHKGTVYRRLNRREYQNTMNDLFGTTLDLESRLPEDGRSHEFDNVGESLGMSMVHLQQYLKAADDVMDAASEKTAEAPEVKTVTSSYADTREGKQFIGKFWKKLSDGSVVFFEKMGYPTGMLRGTEVKPPGRYRIRVTGHAYRSDEPITIRIGGTSFLRGSEKLTHGFAELKPGKESTIELEAIIPNRYMIELDPWGIDTGKYNMRNQGIDDYSGPGMAIKKVELIGPMRESFPGSGHQMLFKDFVRAPVNTKKWQREQAFEVSADNPKLSAEKTLLRIANLAFRRPVTKQELVRYVDLFQSQLDEGASMEVALRASVSAIFCSPDFLYFNEPSGWLNGHAVANRLSYFLTRTMPDKELRQAADYGQLAKDREMLLTHTRRLLNDPRSDRFIIDFCDAWLTLRDIEFTSPDRQLFPEFDQYLQYSMLKESREFVRTLIRENLPISNLVKSEFAMLNDRLAKHYGIEGVTGPKIRKVALSEDSIRGGLLTQASILKVSANGTNTSPVVRGVWVMERIIGKPPQPPPPGIPGVEPDIRGATTLRELLDKHRDIDSCRSCHLMIDPPGFALECFDPIGGYRDRFRSLGTGDQVNLEIAGRKVRYKLGPKVDSSGVLPNGNRFSGFRDFREHLAADQETLATAFTKKLLTFATGREMGFSDRPMIAKIVSKAKENGYRVRDIIELVITSEAFRKK